MYLHPLFLSTFVIGFIAVFYLLIMTTLELDEAIQAAYRLATLKCEIPKKVNYRDSEIPQWSAPQ